MCSGQVSRVGGHAPGRHRRRDCELSDLAGRVVGIAIVPGVCMSADESALKKQEGRPREAPFSFHSVRIVQSPWLLSPSPEGTGIASVKTSSSWTTPGKSTLVGPNGDALRVSAHIGWAIPLTIVSPL